MRSPFIIRQALATEHEALCALFAELDEHHRRERPDVFRKPLGARREASFVNDLIAGPDSTILVAAQSGEKLLGLATVIIRLAAVSSVRDARRFAEIDNLVVRDGARRSGVARSLVTASSAWAQSRDVRSLEVVVWSFNVAAVAFYREIGFAPATERLVINLPTSQS